MAVHKTFWNILQFPNLSSLTLNQIICAISLARCLQHDIELLQPLEDECSGASAPAFLPLAILDFLAESLEIPVEDIKDLWTVIRDDVWDAPSAEEDSKLNKECFWHYGWKRELSREFFEYQFPSPNIFSIDNTVSTASTLHKPRASHRTYYGYGRTAYGLYTGSSTSHPYRIG